MSTFSFFNAFQVIVEDLSNATEVDYSRKYKTLDPTHRVRSHHVDHTSNFNSLERGTRRRLPTVPNAVNTQSLPRPPKVRDQSDSRSRDR